MVILSIKYNLYHMKQTEQEKKYSSKTGMVLELRATMPLKKENRKLELSNHTSRAIRVGDIHEFLIANDYWNEEWTLNNISYIWFFQFNNSWIIEVWDSLIDSQWNVIGAIIWFDYTHLNDGTNNHMNIVLKSNDKRTGTERGYEAGQEFKIPGYNILILQEDTHKKLVTASEALFKILNDLGVSDIFGFPGETSFPLYANFDRFNWRHIIATDERIAGHMADAYARLTNKIGILEVPKVGALWIPPVTLEALESSIPMLVISSDSNQNKVGKHPTCDYDQQEMLRPVTKEQFRIDDPNQLVTTLRRAIQTALSGKPGPVLLEIPSSILSAKINNITDIHQSINCPTERPVASESSIQKTLALLKKAKNPVIIAGWGVHQSQAYEELLKLAERLNIPVATTINGKWSFDETHSSSIGVIWSKWDEYSNTFIKSADLFFVIWSKLGDKSTNQYKLLDNGAKLIHLDIDPKEMGHVFEADSGMVGDAKTTLAQLLDMASNIGTDFSDRKKDLLERKNKRFELYSEFERNEMPIAPSLLFKTLNDIFKGDQVIVADWSSACGWASVFSITKWGIRANINPRGSWMIGYGLPATLGAVSSWINRPIIGVGWDGGFKSTVHGIETAIQNNLDITYFILDDNRLSFMESILKESYGKNPIPKMPATNWEAVAKWFGANALTLETNESLLKFLNNHSWKGVNIVVLKINKDIQSPDLKMSIAKNKK